MLQPIIIIIIIIIVVVVVIVVIVVVLQNKELNIFKIHTIFVWNYCTSVGDKKEYAITERPKKG
jgi:flagellar basal body-associated protein FliL